MNTEFVYISPHRVTAKLRCTKKRTLTHARTIKRERMCGINDSVNCDVIPQSVI